MGNAEVLPKFSGHGDGDHTAEGFDSVVRAKALEFGWSSQETAKNVISAFEGPALAWFEESHEKNVSLRQDWELLRASFLQKYGKKMSLYDQMTGLFLEPKVPQFSGENLENLPVHKFILSLENLSTFKSWTPQETFDQAMASLTGNAAQKVRELPDFGKNWEALKKVLLELFGPHFSLEERLKVFRGLTQKGSESTELFYARVNDDLSKIEGDILKSAQSEEERNAMAKMHKLYSGLVFAEGLNIHVRSKLLKLPVATVKNKLPNLDEIVSTAKTMEQFLKVEKPPQATKPESAPKGSHPSLEKVRKPSASTGPQNESDTRPRQQLNHQSLNQQMNFQGHQQPNQYPHPPPMHVTHQPRGQFQQQRPKQFQHHQNGHNPRQPFQGQANRHQNPRENDASDRSWVGGDHKTTTAKSSSMPAFPNPHFNSNFSCVVDQPPQHAKSKKKQEQPEHESGTKSQKRKPSKDLPPSYEESLKH